MQYVGNDIVDLTDPQSRGKSEDTRFIDRVFTTEEKNLIRKSGNPDATLWSIWAGKETGFKALSKLHLHISSAPRGYTVRLNEERNERIRSGITETPYGCVSIRVFTNEEYIHCVGTTGPPETLNSALHREYRVSEGSKGEFGFSPHIESEAIRNVVKRDIASDFYHDLHKEDIEVIRHKGPRGLGPPMVYVKGEKALFDISLSHHGNYMAYAFASLPESKTCYCPNRLAAIF